MVQEFIELTAQMEAHIDDICLSTNTKEDQYILLQKVLLRVPRT